MRLARDATDGDKPVMLPWKLARDIRLSIAVLSHDSQHACLPLCEQYLTTMRFLDHLSFYAHNSRSTNKIIHTIFPTLTCRRFKFEVLGGIHHYRLRVGPVI